jgi:hypothetical protein
MFNVKIIYKTGDKDFLAYVSEIHYNFDGKGNVAFESPYLQRGMSLPLSEIKEFEAVKMKEPTQKEPTFRYSDTAKQVLTVKEKIKRVNKELKRLRRIDKRCKHKWYEGYPVRSGVKVCLKCNKGMKAK